MEYSACLFSPILHTISCGPCYSHRLLNAEVQFRCHGSPRVLCFGKLTKGQNSLPILPFPPANNTEPMHHIQVRGFKPGRSRRIFQGEKILSTPSFGREVKPSVPCRRFTACERFLNAAWKSGISGKIHRLYLAHIVPPLTTRISGETTSGESWNV